jgi:C-terminal processing protease CtpA/Prc
LQNLVKEKTNFIQQAIDNIKAGINTSNLEDEDKLLKINEIKRILDTQFLMPEMISGSKMWDAAMQAYVAAMGDPFTVYLTAKDNKSLHEELK